MECVQKSSLFLAPTRGTERKRLRRFPGADRVVVVVVFVVMMIILDDDDDDDDDEWRGD